MLKHQDMNQKDIVLYFDGVFLTIQDKCNLLCRNMDPDQSSPLARSSLIRLCSFFLPLNICRSKAEIFQLFAYWIILHAFLSSADFFQNQLFSENSFSNTIGMSNSLTPYLARRLCWA